MPRQPAKPQAREAQTTSPTSHQNRVYLEIDAARILPPLNPVRETFGDEELAGITESIRAVGLIKPLVVVPEGKYFRVSAGHRRLTACNTVGLDPIPCLVHTDEAVSSEALKAHENIFREDVNPVHEARHLKLMLEADAGGDVDVLASMVRLSRQYIDSRLILLRGDERVLEALAANTIAIGVAHELNKVVDPATRLMFLDAAMQGGAAIHMVRQWRTRANAQTDLDGQALLPQDPAGVAQQIAPIATMCCFLCGDDDNPYEMELLYAHKRCRKIILDRFLARLNGEEVSNGSDM